MGFKDTGWAYTLGLPMRETVVLAALCHRTNDSDHTTIIGQNSLAEMMGADRKTVNRALNILDELGVITRSRRNAAWGYRTSDTTVVNVESYVPESHIGEESYVPESPVLCTPQSSPMYPTVQSYVPGGYANEQPVDQSEDQPVDHSDTQDLEFDDFYSIWPRKVNRPAAEKAWVKAIKRSSPTDIINAAIAYRDNPKRPDKTFLQHPATWLNADGWNDDLPERYSSPSSQTPLERAQETQEAGARVAAARQAMFGIDRKELSA